MGRDGRADRRVGGWAGRVWGRCTRCQVGGCSVAVALRCIMPSHASSLHFAARPVREHVSCFTVSPQCVSVLTLRMAAVQVHISPSHHGALERCAHIV